MCLIRATPSCSSFLTISLILLVSLKKQLAQEQESLGTNVQKSIKELLHRISAARAGEDGVYGVPTLENKEREVANLLIEISKKSKIAGIPGFGLPARFSK